VSSTNPEWPPNRSDRADSTASNDVDDEVVSLRREVETLRNGLRDLRDRVYELEEQMGAGGSSLPPIASDYRDARVLEALSPGETVDLQQLQDLYQQRTDIREGDTLRSRVKDLVESEGFEEEGFQRWRYLGPRGGRQ
jgi:hypothetical protein